jgi:glycerol uptake facilitator-like aquaporin
LGGWSGCRIEGPAAYFADFVGTLLLVFFITAVVSLYGHEPSPRDPNPFINFGVIGLVHVLLLFVLIQTLAVISGAHFNRQSPSQWWRCARSSRPTP